MKKLMMVMFLLAGTVVYANAQTPKKTPVKLPKALSAQLSLTTDQQSKVDAILQAKAKKIDSLNAQTDKKGIKKVKKDINADVDAQIEAVLTDTQKKAYTDFQEAKKAKAKAKADAGATPPAATPPGA